MTSSFTLARAYSERRLAASAYTNNLRNAIRLACGNHAGIVTVDRLSDGDTSIAFGGYRESGFGGRDKSLWGQDQYTEIKTIWIKASRSRHPGPLP
ncbi:aldehyde dehydrogenase (NAD(+)) [Pseudomonas psychrotolerans L19]|nr:aldehyde dehydrogenase (NAD(+)) [Pseudomonas psychrotolerans L19]